MPVAFEQLRERAKPWLAPIAGPSPAGASAKLEPEYQEVAGEVAKLDALTGGVVDWKRVAAGSTGLLQGKTKDLLLASYLAQALHATGGVDGLTTGVTLLAELMDGYWETLFPEVKRLRGRANAIQWLVERMQLSLPAADGAPLEHLEGLEAALRRLAQLAREKLQDASPAFGPVLEAVDRLKLVAAPPPEAAQPAPAPAAAAPASAAPAPAAPLPAAPASLSSAADATEFLARIGDALVEAAGTLRRADPAGATAYRILRAGLWLHVSAPPPVSGGKTAVPPPAAPLRAQLATIAQNAAWDALLEETEAACDRHRFWLDLHRLSWQALGGLGATAARDAVATGVRALLARLPQLATLAFADGTPFADAATRAWIDEQLGAAGGPRRELAAAPSGGAGDDLAEARRLLAAGDVAQGLARFAAAASAARAGRERFALRLELARACVAADLAAVAKATYDDLEREVRAHALDVWEPALAAECLKGLIGAARSLAKDPRAAAPELADLYRRLCSIDPAAAHEVWP